MFKPQPLRVYFCSLLDYNPDNVPTSVTIPADELRTCFVSDSVEDDDDAMEDDETFMLEITDNDPDDPRIIVREPMTTVIIVDDDGKIDFNYVHVSFWFILSGYFYLWW